MSDGDAAQHDHESPREPRKRRSKLWALAAIAAVLLSLFTVWRIAVAVRLNREVATLRADGYPMSMAELRDRLDRPPPPPPGKNGAEVYRRAFKQFVQPLEKDHSHLPILGRSFDSENIRPHKPLTPRMMEAAQRHLDRNEQALHLLRRAVELERVRWRNRLEPRTNHSRVMRVSQLRELSEIREAANLFALQAMVHGERDRSAEAAESLRDVWRVQDALDERPFMIDRLVQVAVRALAVHYLERAMNRTRFAPPSLVMLQETFHVPRVEERVREALIADLAREHQGWGFHLLDVEIIRTGGRWTALRHVYSDTFGHSKHLTGLNNLYRAAGFMDMDHLIYLTGTHSVLRATESGPLRRWWAEAQKIRDGLERAPHLYTQVTRSQLFSDRFFLVELRVLAQLRCARAALAVERYRIANDEPPAKLADLVPEYLDAVPADPFTGKPLRYKRDRSSFTVYSVGEDTTDDGGRREDAAGERLQPGTDIPFTIAR